MEGAQLRACQTSPYTSPGGATWRCALRRGALSGALACKSLDRSALQLELDYVQLGCFGTLMRTLSPYTAITHVIRSILG